MPKPPEDEAAKQRLMFEEFLMKCMRLETKRRVLKSNFDPNALKTPGFEAIKAFCSQAASDVEFLLRGALPDDIVRMQQENERKALATALEQIQKQGGDINEAEVLRKAGLQKVKLPNGGFKLVGI